MFGYVQIRKQELKIKDYETYHAFYCGLCERLRKRYGFSGQITLTYDMTFMVMLLTSVYDVKPVRMKKHCVVHPAKKYLMAYNEITDYCADMNMILSYYHCLDDKSDEKSLKGYAGTALYGIKVRKVFDKYPRQVKAIRSSLRKLSEYEQQNNCNLMQVADCFGKLLGELLVYKEDYFKEYLSDVGYFLGRFIYIMDAYDDLDKDIEKGSYNPFRKYYRDDFFEQKVYNTLLDEISMACGAFEQLPCVDYIDILRNILYAGVWNKYDKLTADKKKELSERRREIKK